MTYDWRNANNRRQPMCAFERRYRHGPIQPMETPGRIVRVINWLTRRKP